MDDIRALERLADKMHDNSMLIRDLLFEVQEIRDVIKQEIAKQPKPRVVRNPPREYIDKPPNCS